MAVLALAACAPSAHASAVAIRPASHSETRAAFFVRHVRPLQVLAATLRDADGSRRHLSLASVRAAVRARRAVRVRLRRGAGRPRLIVVLDRFAPTRPGAPRGHVSVDRVHLTWSAAEDDRRVVRYLVWRAVAGRRFPAQPQLSTASRSADDFPGRGTWRYAVAGVDPSGNVGRRALLTLDVLLPAPLTPGGHGVVPPPPPGHSPSPPGTAVVAAVGDIACSPTSLPRIGGCRQADVGAAIAARGFDGVLTLGDEQYPNGALAPASPFDLAFGSFKASIRPVPGNHEYLTAGAASYYDYFGAVAGARDQGYYSFDLRSWHIVALNSNCTSVPCDDLSPQVAWLRADLAAHPSRCTLAYMHHARFASGPHGQHTNVQPLWQALQDAGADLVLASHDHVYEHLDALTAAGALGDPAGLPSFIVGTGGASHDKFKPLPALGSLVRDATSFGYLELTLRPTGYDWVFRPVADGVFTDAGSAACH